MKESVDSIIAAIKPVAEKIGEGAAHLYEVYARQMFAEGIAGLIITAFGLIVGGISLIFLFRWVLKSRDGELQGLVTVFLILPISCAMIFGTMATLTDNITKIVNPEYHAVQRILDTVKGK